MAEVRSATLPTGTKVTGPAHVIDRMAGKAKEPAPKPAKKAASKSEK